MKMRLNLVNPQRAVDHGQQVRPVLAAPSLSCLITKFDSDHHQDDDYDDDYDYDDSDYGD